MWDLSFPTRNQTHAPCTGTPPPPPPPPPHWATREVPLLSFKICPQGFSLLPIVLDQIAANGRYKTLLLSRANVWSTFYVQSDVPCSCDVAQSCPTLCDPMDYSLPGSSVPEIFQARVLEWVAISFSRGSSWPRDRTWASRIAARRFTIWATREAYEYISVVYIEPAMIICKRRNYLLEIVYFVPF